MHFSRFFGPLDAWPRYPWKFHLLMLLPLSAALLYIGLSHGWWGSAVRDIYQQAYAAYPVITETMRFISGWGSFILYFFYLALLLHGVNNTLPGDPPHPDFMLVRRYILFSLLFTLLLTQILKYSLGMPRPLASWPPEPFSFNLLYNSFPSGHTTEIVATALPLALRFRHLPLRTRLPLLVALALLVALVGYSRIWLSRHHPVDIVGGMILGSLIARLISYCPDTAEATAASPEPPSNL